jgi:hypothetical protein
MRVGAYINEVCLLFNLEVLIDIADDGAALNIENRCTHHDPGSVPLNVQVAIGVRAGTEEPYSFNMTRWYPSEDALDEFCELNINRFRIAAKEYHEKCAPVPDATEWR